MIERVGDFRNTDYSVRFLMNNLFDLFSDKSNWKAENRPYILALLKLAANHSDKFRRNAYTFDGVRFTQHKKDKKKTKSFRALQTLAAFRVRNH